MSGSGSQQLKVASHPDGGSPKSRPPLDELLADAATQEARVDRLLGNATPDKPTAESVQFVWSRDMQDPEFRKNLRIFYRLITGAEGICQRTRSAHDARHSDKDALHVLEARLAELQRWITLPSDTPLNLLVLLGHRFALEHLLVELGDVHYLRARASELYAEDESTYTTWRAMYKHPPPLLVDGEHAPAGSALADTRAMVAQLLAAKESEDFPNRARRELKQQVLAWPVLPLVAMSLVGFAIAAYFALGQAVLFAVAAAVAGAAVGRLIHLRDEVRYGSQVREFVSLFVAQLAIGVVTGLVVSVAATLPVLNLGGPSGVAAVSFAAGFSEATFLKLVSRIAGEPSP